MASSLGLRRPQLPGTTRIRAARGRAGGTKCRSDGTLIVPGDISGCRRSPKRRDRRAVPNARDDTGYVFCRPDQGPSRARTCSTTRSGERARTLGAPNGAGRERDRQPGAHPEAAHEKRCPVDTLEREVPPLQQPWRSASGRPQLPLKTGILHEMSPECHPSASVCRQIIAPDAPWRTDDSREAPAVRWTTDPARHRCAPGGEPLPRLGVSFPVSYTPSR